MVELDASFELGVVVLRENVLDFGCCYLGTVGFGLALFTPKLGVSSFVKFCLSNEFCYVKALIERELLHCLLLVVSCAEIKVVS